MLRQTAVVFAGLMVISHAPTGQGAPLDFLTPLGAQDKKNDNVTDSSWSKTAGQRWDSCGAGGEWIQRSYTFDNMAQEGWNIESGLKGVSGSKRKLTLTLEEEMASTGGIVIASKEHWYPPVNIKVDIKASGAGGIVNAFILKGPGTSGDEIDAELAGNTFQLPVWKDGVRLTKDGKSVDVRQSLRHGTSEQPESQYYYRYPGYDPRKWQQYELEWTPNSILWTIAGQERVQFDKKRNKFPGGPLPIRFGPWSTEPGRTWAGTLDWNKNPQPKMELRNLVIEGCRA